MGYKGMICYNIKTSKFIISRHIIHDESQFPYKLKTILNDRDIQGSQFKSQTPIVVQVPIPGIPMP